MYVYKWLSLPYKVFQLSPLILHVPHVIWHVPFQDILRFLTITFKKMDSFRILSQQCFHWLKRENPAFFLSCTPIKNRDTEQSFFQGTSKFECTTCKLSYGTSNLSDTYHEFLHVVHPILHVLHVRFKIVYTVYKEKSIKLHGDINLFIIEQILP